MKLVTFKPKNDPSTRTGALADQIVIDLNLAYTLLLDANRSGNDIRQTANRDMPTEMIDLFESGSLKNGKVRQAVDFALEGGSENGDLVGPKGEKVIYQLNEVDLKAPVLRPGSIRDTFSFEDHVMHFEKRTKRPIPEMWYQIPVYYKGNTRSVVGPDTLIEWPRYTSELDYELEFGIYIGKQGKNIAAEDAHEYIAGYTIFNDFSARDAIQKEVSVFLGPSKGKDFDTGNVMGPCLVTPDELDVNNLDMEARINGEVWSKGNSSYMYWKFPTIIEYISNSETLYPGDFIGSGTIANGCGDEMDRWIKPGDTVELEVEGIGILRNVIGERQ